MQKGSTAYRRRRLERRDWFAFMQNGGGIITQQIGRTALQGRGKPTQPSIRQTALAALQFLYLGRGRGSRAGKL